MPGLSANELAELVPCTTENLARLDRLGLLSRGEDGLYPPSDVHVVRLMAAFEESGVSVAASDLEPRGLLTYHFPHREAWSQESSVFVCRTWVGEPSGSDELDPEWFALDEVPYGEMWDDARRWLPEVLGGGRVRRTFVFGEDLATVVAEHGSVA